jgi:hypothetical protein
MFGRETVKQSPIVLNTYKIVQNNWRQFMPMLAQQYISLHLGLVTAQYPTQVAGTTMVKKLIDRS